MPETPDALDQSGAILRVRVGVGAVVPYAVWRQALDRALAALEMPGIVVLLGPVGVGRIFLRELITGLQESECAVTFLPHAVTFLPRANLPRWWPPGSALIIEDAAGMDAAMLEEICRSPGRRAVLVGLPAFALFELPVPLTVVTFEPLSPEIAEPLSFGTAAPPRSFFRSKARAAIASGVLASALAKLPAPLTRAPLTVVPTELLSLRAAAPRSSSRSNARVAIASGVVAATAMAGALLWTRAPRAPPAPAPSRVAVLQPAVELPPAPRFPPAPAEPAPSASKQPGDATSAAAPAPRPVGDGDRPGIGTSLERPAVPAVTRTEPRSGSKPAPPQLQAGPSPVPDSREALNLPPAAAIAAPPLTGRATPSEPAAPSGKVPQLLPDNAPIRVVVSYAPRSAAARQEAAGVVRLLRGGGIAASDPAPATRVAGKAGITYFFAEDRDGARRVERDLGEGFGHSRLSPAARTEPLPRPGTIEVLVPAR